MSTVLWAKNLISPDVYELSIPKHRLLFNNDIRKTVRISFEIFKIYHNFFLILSNKNKLIIIRTYFIYYFAATRISQFKSYIKFDSTQLYCYLKLIKNTASGYEGIYRWILNIFRTNIYPNELLGLIED